MTKSSSTSQVVELRQQHLLHQSEIHKQICSVDVEKQENIFTDDVTVAFEGKCFQFSGTLEFGKREDAILVVEKLGGYIPSGNSLTTLVDYLVVGDLEKQALKRNGYGGKINKAMNLNREAHRQIQIILECDFVKAVLKAIHKSEIKETPVTQATITYKSLADRASKINKSNGKAVHFT